MCVCVCVVHLLVWIIKCSIFISENSKIEGIRYDTLTVSEINFCQHTLNVANTLKVLKNIYHETESPGLLFMCVKEY